MLFVTFFHFFTFFLMEECELKVIKARRGQGQGVPGPGVLHLQQLHLLRRREGHAQGQGAAAQERAQ